MKRFCRIDAIRGALACLLFTLVGGCAGTIVVPYEESSERDVILETLDNRIVQLTTNIERLGKQITLLQQTQDPMDPTHRALRALDLAGWQLHQQQWMLQRDHLRLVKMHLQRAREAPEEKPRLLTQWGEHEQQYQATLADLRQQRHALEQHYVQIESQVVEQYLR
jgi:prefoldin subunit 5